MTATEKTVRALAPLKTGEWVNGFTPELSAALARCEELCFEFNSISPARKQEQHRIIRQLFGSIGDNFTIHAPFHCDFGANVHIGDNFVGNFNLTILDEAEVLIGNNVFIGPNSTLCTVTHTLDYTRRNSGIMKADPIVIGDNVWIAAGVTVLPGVTIGSGAVIGAGSVVTKNIPCNVLAVGNPCRVIRNIEQTVAARHL